MLGTAVIAVTMSGLALLRGPAVFLSWFRHDMSQTSDPLLAQGNFVSDARLGLNLNLNLNISKSIL